MGRHMISIRHLPLERRTNKRYLIEAPVMFSWRDIHGIRLTADGVTRDIGTKSAYIESVDCPPLDILVEVEIILLFDFGIRRELRIRGVAAVKRVERPSQNNRANGFAIARIGSIQWNLEPDPRCRPQLTYIHGSTACQN